VGAVFVVVPSPFFDERGGLSSVAEPLRVEALVKERRDLRRPKARVTEQGPDRVEALWALCAAERRAIGALPPRQQGARTVGAVET
jgi:hypothetical protein